MGLSRTYSRGGVSRYASGKRKQRPATNVAGIGEPGQTTLRDAFKSKYPEHIFILDMFELANHCAATWRNLTKVRLQRFIDFAGTQVSPNSVNQYAKRFKAVLNLYSDEVELPKDYAKVLTTRNVASTAVYLTERELQKLIDYTPKNSHEMYVRDMFVICSYVGCRHSDGVRLTKSNFVGEMLQYVSIKTRVQSVVPLKPIVREYILNRPHEDIDDTTYNRIIRRICQKCGITDIVKVFKAGKEQEAEKWRFVSSHTARRTCATLLYLRGVDLFTISKILGHTDIKTTQNYIRADIRTDSPELMGFFA